MEAKTKQPNVQSSASQRVKKSELPLSEVDPHSARQKSAQDKLQLFETIQSMQRDGRMPHNDHLNELLDKLKTNKVISSREHLMSYDGQRLLHDFRKLIQTVQKSLAVKNKEELFQSLVYHLHCMESPIKKEHISATIQSTHDKSEIQSEGKKASDAMFKIGKLILINNEFRSVLGDLIDVSQDIFNNVTGKMGDSLQQTGSDLQDNNQTDKSGKHLVDKALDSALKSKDQGDQSLQHEHTSLHDSDHHPGNRGHAGESVHPNVSSGESTDVNTTGYQGRGNSFEHSSIPGQQDMGTSEPLQGQGSDSQASHGVSKQTPQNIKESAMHHPMYQNARKQAKEHKQHVQKTVKENIPKEKQDELIHRLQRAAAEVQKHPDYQDAINTLVQLIKTWSSRLTKVSEDVASQGKENDKPEQMSYREEAERELKAILECWAQRQSIDPLLHGVQNVIHDMQNDQQLREYYHTVMKYVDRLVREPGYASQDEAVEEGRRLMDQSNHIVKGRYSDHLNYLSSESRKIMNLMAEDEVSKELNETISTIHRDLWMDSDGNPAFKPHLLNDLKMTLLPAFIDEIKYIPIPRIEYSDSQFDIVVENLILTGDTLLPNVFDTKMESFNSFSLRSTTESKPSHQSMYIRMSEIQAEIDDAVFFYKKKTGFPKISDRGVVSLSVGGKGISVSLRLSSVTDNPAKTFKVAYCKCHVDNLNIKVSDSNHDILYKTIRPLVIGLIRKQVAKSVQMKVIDLLNQADQKLTSAIVNMNQGLQNRVYDALPEQDKAGTRPPSLSQTCSRPGLFSTMIALMNNNIKSKVAQRNENRRLSGASGSRPTSQHYGAVGNTQHSGSVQKPLPEKPQTGNMSHEDYDIEEQRRNTDDSGQKPLPQTPGATNLLNQGFDTEERYRDTDRDAQQSAHQKHQANTLENQGFGTGERLRDTGRDAQQSRHQKRQTKTLENQSFDTGALHPGSDSSHQLSLHEHQQTYLPVNQGFDNQERYPASDDVNRKYQQIYNPGNKDFGNERLYSGSDSGAQQTYNPVNQGIGNQGRYDPKQAYNPASERHHSIASPPLSPVKNEFDIPAQKLATDNMANLTNVDAPHASQH